MNEELQKQLEAAKELKILGYFTWWSIHSAKVTHEELVKSFQELGLPSHWLIPDITPEAAFNKACQKVNRTRSTKRKGNKSNLLRTIKKDNNHIVMGIVEETLLEPLPATENTIATNRGLEYNHINSIFFDRKTGEISSAFLNDEIVAEIKEYYADFLTYHNSNDICRQIRTCIEGLVCLHVRDHGGVYFVLESSKPILDAIEKFVKNNAFGDIYILPQVDLDQTKKALTKVFLDDVNATIKEFDESITEWADKLVHLKTLDNGISDVSNLKTKIDSYSKALEVVHGKFDSPIVQLENKIKELQSRKLK